MIVELCQQLFWDLYSRDSESEEELSEENVLRFHFDLVDSNTLADIEYPIQRGDEVQMLRVSSHEGEAEFIKEILRLICSVGNVHCARLIEYSQGWRNCEIVSKLYLLKGQLTTQLIVGHRYIVARYVWRLNEDGTLELMYGFS